MKDFGKATARRALTTAANVASDLAQGGNLGDTLKAHGKVFLKDSLTDGIQRMAGRQRKTASTVVSRSPPPRKRFRGRSRRRRGKGRGLF